MTDQMTITKDETTRKEEFQVTGEMLLSKIEELVHEGNVRRIVVTNETGHVIAEFPMTADVVSAILLPVWAAIADIAALPINQTIVVERRDWRTFTGQARGLPPKTPEPTGLRSYQLFAEGFVLDLHQEGLRHVQEV